MADIIINNNSIAMIISSRSNQYTIVATITIPTITITIIAIATHYSG
jgi:hypothetical protein